MEKIQSEKFKKDEEQDILLIKETLQKEKNLVKVAAVLSQKFKQKYGPEFGGLVTIDFDLVEKIFKLNCGKEYEIEIDEDDVEDIPVRIKMFREQALEEKLKPKPKPSLIPKKPEAQKQSLKTEGGKDIKVAVKNTKDAEKEMMEEDDDDEDDDENEKPVAKPAIKPLPRTQPGTKSNVPSSTQPRMQPAVNAKFRQGK